MADFRAFRALRPAPDQVETVSCVPYDVVNTAEARALCAELPESLLHVTRPDVDLPDGASLYDDAAYAQAKTAFDRILREGSLLQDDAPGFFVYAQTMGAHHQVGLVGAASASDYWADRIKKHEFTRPQKEDDRMRHIETVRAHLGPVFLAYRASASIDARIELITSEAPEVDFIAPDGVRHQLWPVYEAEHIEALEVAFAVVPALYIADGHHRSAAAARIGRDAKAGDPKGQFLAVAFPHDQLAILPYNRVVADLMGRTPAELLTALEAEFNVSRLDGAQAPEARHGFSMYLDGAWYALVVKHAIDEADPVARLDVSLLQDRLLAPLLGIKDPRRDTRVDFVGGIRGLDELARRVDGGAAVAIAMFPTSLDDLMSIADAGEVMPPKSTWFEPKLRTGLVISQF